MPALITIGIGLAVLVPLVVWGAVVRQTVAEDIARREADQRLLSARLARSSIEAAIDEVSRRLGLFATRASLRAALDPEDPAALEADLVNLVQDTTYATALVLDGEGRLLARHPAAPETYGQSFADRDYYQGALNADGPYISEVVISRITGQTLVVVARAVRAQQGVLGLLLVTLTPTHLLGVLDPLRSTPGREIHLVDQRSRVIASTDPARTPLSELRFPAIEQSEFAQIGSAMASIDGVSKVVTYAPVRVTGWTLLVSDDPSVLLAAQRQLERQLIVGGAATTLLALLAAAGIAWLYTTSLRQRTVLADREAALQRVNEELATASRHKSDFLAGMSHELRTPLNAILGFSELLDEQLVGVTSERQKRYLRNIREAGEHLLGLINEVLDLSKVEAGRLELRPEHITMDALFAPVTESIGAAASSRTIAFEVDVDAAELVVDPGRMRQIVYNLLSNAVKFTPPGGSVRLRAHVEDRALRIAVSDTGIGIPAEKRDRLFGTFERLHEGRSDAPGTGLGLALTKRLVELQGGTIVAASEEGKGTSFVVRVPDVVVDRSVTRRVLIIEDEARDADLTVALATKARLRTEVARSLTAARAAIARSIPIGVVLDLRLPDGRGELILEELRDDPATRAVPVIVITVEDDGDRSRLLGADDHLTKPIDHARLDAWLRRVAARNERTEVHLASASGG
ncbi:MAG TPA: ATP-binding protein [Candidatus Limnocylindria bacterium]|nr:ATP-binding protein [Candidatus Limnocylindria bacterium]